MKTIIRKLTTTIAVLIILTGCANIPQQKFDKAKSTHIKTIALLGVPEPKEYMAFNIGGVGMAFGLIGGLIEGHRGVSNSEKLTNKLKKNDVNLGKSLQIELTRKLEKSGYNVVLIDKERPKYNDKKMPDYSQIQTDADAILDVWHVVSGYVSPAGSSDYKLWVRVGARMVDSKNKELLYHQLFNYGEELHRLDEIIYYPEHQPKTYPNFESLLANVPALKKSMRNSSPVISRGIVSQL